MMKIVFRSPSGLIFENYDISKLKNHIIDEFPQYWNDGSGSGTIDFYDNNQIVKSLLILPNEETGIYLQYIGAKSVKVKEIWLSLEDSTKLNQITEICDELYASVGLFLSPEKAWVAIEEFYKTGERSNKIQWISPEDIPEDGNW